ncbi:MAG: ElyC/SanA/YdcF family protein [Polyangia bacterium]|jgi:uncharacterized SAM-binding protein YcdF (DUF218 family)
MFALKKLLSAALQPGFVLLIVMLVGLILLWFSKKQRAAKALLTAGLALLALLFLDPVARALVRPLEATYPPLLAEATQTVSSLPDGSPAPRWVVVLGGGHIDNRSLAASQQLSAPTLARLAEGIRLQRLLPESKLVLSGGGNRHEATEAGLLAGAGTSLGAPRERMVLESQSRDTIDEVRALHATLGQERFVLVTSATHLPRAMAMFEKAGMNPIPAPTDYLDADESADVGRLFALIPRAGAAGTIERALHEYLGLFWARLRGQAR